MRETMNSEMNMKTSDCCLIVQVRRFFSHRRVTSSPARELTRGDMPGTEIDEMRKSELPHLWMNTKTKRIQQPLLAFVSLVL